MGLNRLALTPKQEQSFARWYLAYPNKKAKGEARARWGKLDPDDALTERMIAAIQDQIRERAWKKVAGIWMPEWKLPATWLNKECWEDETQPIPSADAKGSRKAEAAIEAVKRSVDKISRNKNGEQEDNDRDLGLPEGDIPF